MFRQSVQRATFYLCVIFVFPILILAVAPREDIYPRYFLNSVLFTLLLWSDILGSIWRRGKFGRVFTIVALLAFMVANSRHIADLIILQRNHYLPILQTIEEQTKGARAIVLVDNPSRQDAMLDFYARQLSMTRPIETYPPSSETSFAAEWYLVHSLDSHFEPPETITAPGGVAFHLVEHDPFAGLSGWDLSLYHREP
ncbi:MAG TPA: hypothetical protein VFE46_17395 [Pirellulales bacterium]|nr:hypothetical protein [Pirellulales bacterium]